MVYENHIALERAPDGGLPGFDDPSLLSVLAPRLAVPPARRDRLHDDAIDLVKELTEGHLLDAPVDAPATIAGANRQDVETAQIRDALDQDSDSIDHLIERVCAPDERPDDGDIDVIKDAFAEAATIEVKTALIEKITNDIHQILDTYGVDRAAAARICRSVNNLWRDLHLPPSAIYALLLAALSPGAATTAGTIDAVSTVLPAQTPEAVRASVREKDGPALVQRYRAIAESAAAGG